MILLRFIDLVIWLVPVWLMMRVGRGLGSLVYVLDRKHRKIAFNNLKKAFPEYTMPQVKKIAKQTFQHLVLIGIEVLILSRKSPSTFRDRVFDDGLKNLEKAKEQKKSILFLTGHVGNWELLAKLGRWAGFIESVIARDVKSKKVQRWIQSIRARYHVNVISKGQIRHIVQEFKEGRTVGALIDQDGGRRGSFVSFFGRPASTPSGVIRLGLRLGIPILPAFLRRTSDHLEYRCLIGEDITIGLENLSLQEKEKIVLQRFASTLEKFIREDPAQWLWLHRRWKTRPLGEFPIFQKRVLLLNDGKAGHFNQVLGIFKGLDSWEGQVCPVQFRSKFHRGVVYALAFFLLSSMRILRWGLTEESVKALPVWAPSLIMACGSTSASVAFFLRNYYGSKSVVLMRSGFPHVEKLFDLALLPIHDCPPQNPKVIPLFGIPTPIIEEEMNQAGLRLREKLNLRAGKRIGFLVGGNSRHSQMDLRRIEEISCILLEIYENREWLNMQKDSGGSHFKARLDGRINEQSALGVGAPASEQTHGHQSVELQILLATSRRTPIEVEKILSRHLEDKSFIHLLWAKDYPDNPIPGILGLSHVILVTEDSFSMLMEAIHSGKPVISLRLTQELKPSKYEQTLQALEKEGRIYRSSVPKLKELLQGLLNRNDLSRKADNPERDQSVQAILKLVEQA